MENSRIDFIFKDSFGLIEKLDGTLTFPPDFPPDFLRYPVAVTGTFVIMDE